MIWDNEPKNPLKCTLKVDRQILKSCLFWLKRQIMQCAMSLFSLFTSPHYPPCVQWPPCPIGPPRLPSLPCPPWSPIPSCQACQKARYWLYHPNIFHVLLIMQSVWRYSLFFRLIMKTLYDRWLRGCWREKYGRCLQFIQQRSLSYFWYQSCSSYDKDKR